MHPMKPGKCKALCLAALYIIYHSISACVEEVCLMTHIDSSNITPPIDEMKMIPRSLGKTCISPHRS